MRSAITVTPAQLPGLLLHVSVVRPVFVWGPPGIGKSSLVREFAASLGLDCVTLVGTQLAAEDLIGVPELRDGRSRFAPPETIAREGVSRGSGRVAGEVQVSSRKGGGWVDTGVVSAHSHRAARRKLGPAAAVMIHGTSPGPTACSWTS